jgi:putative endonuclease
LGQRGEQIVAEYLTNLGWQILDRNWRGRDGELDLVASDHRTLVVVEVKTRSGVGFGSAVSAVTYRKYARLRRLAAQWLEEHDWHPSAVRIDVIGLLLDGQTANCQIDHIEGAFR